MVSSWLATFHIRVRVCNGMFGSLLISSKIEMLAVVLMNRGSFSFFSVVSTSLAERLIFLGTELSFAICSNICVHWFITSLKSFAIQITFR